MSTSDRLDQIAARAGAATEGPWEKRTVIGWEKVVSYGTEAMIQLVAECRHDECDIADAEFIAHARTDVPALVAALRAVLDVLGPHYDSQVKRNAKFGRIGSDCLCDGCNAVRAITAALGEA